MFESKIKKMRICEGQNEILRIKAVIPSNEKYPRISGFYEDISEKAISFCAKNVGEQARADYTESRANGTFPARYYYSLFCDLIFMNGEIAVVRIRVELKRGNTLLDSASDTQWWELESEKMIPAKIALKEHFEWQKDFGKIRRKTHVDLEEKGVFALLRGKRRCLGNLIEKSQ